MKNTRQVPLGPEGNDAPTLQQLMDTVKALQKANEQYRRKQEWIQRGAKAKQERLLDEVKAEKERLVAEAMAEAMAEAKAEQEKLIAEARAQQLIR